MMKKLHIRIITATSVGILLGVWNYYSTANGLPVSIAIQKVGLVGMIGFTIGASALKMNWLSHGSLIGFIGSLPVSLVPLVLGDIGSFLIFSFYGVFYGIVIELFTSLIFKLSPKEAS
jgi:hypothetical protein